VDVIAGPVRRTFGDKVTVKLPIPTYDEFCKAAQHNARTTSAYFYPGVQTTDEEVLTMMFAHWLGQMALFSGTKDLSGWENFENLDTIELRAPLPTNPLTLEVIEEEGIKVDDIVGWPHNSQPWALATDLVEEYDAPAKDYFRDYMSRHDKDWIGYIFKTLACDAHFYTMAAAEGEDQVVYDYTVVSKVCSMLLENRVYPDPSQPSNKVKLLADRLDIWETIGFKPAFKEIVEFCSAKGIVLKPIEP